MIIIISQSIIKIKPKTDELTPVINLFSSLKPRKTPKIIKKQQKSELRADQKIGAWKKNGDTSGRERTVIVSAAINLAVCRHCSHFLPVTSLPPAPVYK